MIDNYDSFTYNLVQMFMRYDLIIEVYRSDMISLDDISAINPDFVLISPGPKDPAHAGISTKLIQTFFDKLPILGVCLGMQCITRPLEEQLSVRRCQCTERQAKSIIIVGVYSKASVPLSLQPVIIH